MSNYWLVKQFRHVNTYGLSVNEQLLETDDRIDNIIPLVWLKMQPGDLITISLAEIDSERYINHHYQFDQFWLLHMRWLRADERFETWILTVLSEN